MTKSIHEQLKYENGNLYWIEDGHKRNAGDLAGFTPKDNHKTLYNQIFINGSLESTHKIIYKMFNPDYVGMVDHINGNRRDNRIENLRACTRSENNRNASLRKDSLTGIKGVGWKEKTKRFIVRVYVGGKRRYFGSYKDIELAELVATEARNKYHGKFAKHY